MPKIGSQIKRLKCSVKKPLNKDTQRVLKNFKNIKEFSDSSQNTIKKEKDEKENEDYFCIFCGDKYMDPPLKTGLCATCAKNGLTRIVLTDSQHRWVINVISVAINVST